MIRFTFYKDYFRSRKDRRQSRMEAGAEVSDDGGLDQDTGRQMGEMWTDMINIWKGISVRLADRMGVWLKKRAVRSQNPKYQLVKLVAGAIFRSVLDKVSLRPLLVFYKEMLIGSMDSNMMRREELELSLWKS